MTLAKTEHSELVLVESDPEREILFQTKVANALMNVIKQGQAGKFVTKIQGKDFLGFEAWQTIARMNQCNVVVESTVPILDEAGDIIAYDSWAKVTRADGELVSRANMECGMDAFPVRGKEGRERHKAAKSTSQTWAGAKACRMAFSFVAVLAGYEATTAEEMISSASGDDQGSRQAQPGAGGWLITCPEHRVNWFKTEKMRDWSHKYNDDKDWCSRSDVLKPRLEAELKKLTGDSWSMKEINELLKSEYDKTWSALSTEEKMGGLKLLFATPPPGTETPAAEEPTQDTSQDHFEPAADEDTDPSQEAMGGFESMPEQH